VFIIKFVCGVGGVFTAAAAADGVGGGGGGVCVNTVCNPLVYV